MSWPILSVVTFLPLVGVLFILVQRRLFGRRKQLVFQLWRRRVFFGRRRLVINEQLRRRLFFG